MQCPATGEDALLDRGDIELDGELQDGCAPLNLERALLIYGHTLLV